MRAQSVLISLLACALLAGCAPQPSGGSAGNSANGTTNGGTAGTGGQQGSSQTKLLPETMKVPTHIVIVVEENHSYSQIAGNKNAPYINQLMKEGANFTSYHALEHPSQPNYLDLFSGSNQGVTNDSCPNTFSAPSLGSQLLSKGGASLSFAGYSEGLPTTGFTGCSAGAYARKHSPWVDFSNIPASANQPFSNFPKDYNQLPTVAFVIPDLNHDMHNGTIQAADTWLQQNLSSYVSWAKTHNSMLIVTWDEANGSTSNRVPTIMVGPMIKPGNYSEKLNHFNLLHTIESMYGLPALGKSKLVSPITNIWTQS